MKITPHSVKFKSNFSYFIIRISKESKCYDSQSRRLTLIRNYKTDTSLERKGNEKSFRILNSNTFITNFMTIFWDIRPYN